MLQNSPSTVAAEALGAEPGMHVLDMCASPGGKTCAIACSMQNTGTIIALDRTIEKARIVRDTAAEQGITCVTAVRKDATQLIRTVSRFEGEAVAGELASDVGRLAHANACDAGQEKRRARRAAAAARHGHPLPKDCRRAEAGLSDALPGVWYKARASLLCRSQFAPFKLSCQYFKSSKVHSVFRT
jgi:hypothetical protein